MMSVQVVNYEIFSQPDDVNDVVEDNQKGEEAPKIEGKEAAADSEEARLEAKTTHHRDPIDHSGLHKETVLEPSGEQSGPEEEGKNEDDEAVANKGTENQLAEEQPEPQPTTEAEEDAAEHVQKDTGLKRNGEKPGPKEEGPGDSSSSERGDKNPSSSSSESDSATTTASESTSASEEERRKRKKRKKRKKKLQRGKDEDEEALADKGTVGELVEEQPEPEAEADLTEPEQKEPELERKAKDALPAEKSKSESGEAVDHEAEPVPKIATTIKKSKMTIYLSCNNVTSLKTFCEVKLQVCVSAKYSMIGTGVRVKCVLQLLVMFAT